MELKPCPFCGCEADFDEDSGDGVTCAKTEGSCGFYFNNDGGWTRKEVAALWNRRPSPSPESGDDTASRHVTEMIKAIHANREKLLEAWIAETGLGPSESMLVEQHMGDGTVRVYVKRKETAPEQSDRERAETLYRNGPEVLDGERFPAAIAALLAEVRAEERERALADVREKAQALDDQIEITIEVLGELAGTGSASTVMGYMLTDQRADLRSAIKEPNHGN